MNQSTYKENQFGHEVSIVEVQDDKTLTDLYLFAYFPEVGWILQFAVVCKAPPGRVIGYIS